MHRRQVLKLCAAHVAGLGLTSLGGCSGGGDDGQSQSNTCTSASFALGLNITTPEMLTGIARVSANAYASPVATSSVTIAGSIPTYFNLTDPAFLAGYGERSGALPPPSQQGQLGSCVAWGVGYAMSSFINARATNTLSQTASSQASPADLYAKVLRREPANSCGNGTYIKDALNVMVDEGIASLADLPYSDRACAFPSPNAKFFLDGYHTISVTDSTAIKYALSNFFVLPFGMQVYRDFQNHKGSLTYNHSRSDNSCPLGGHCMSIVGFDDTRGAYRVINSWGVDTWGDNGYAWISYDTFERLATEVYSPYLTPANARSTLLSSPASISGSIRAITGYTRTILNEASKKFDKAWCNFKLNDAIVMNSYRLYYFPRGQTTPIDLGGVKNDQILRGSLFEFTFQDDAFLRANPVGTFALNIIGTSRFRENINLTIYTQYPDPNGR